MTAGAAQKSVKRELLLSNSIVYQVFPTVYSAIRVFQKNNDLINSKWPIHVALFYV